MLEDPKQVVVYRVEHAATGRGPYREEFYDQMVTMHEEHDMGSHPAPHKDGMDTYVLSYMLFGFESTEQLDAWFEPKFKQMLHDLGFIIREYMVPIDSVEVGGHQVAFDQDLSSMCGEKNLVEALVS